MDTEVKQALDDLQKSVHDFQAKNDERLKEMADKGSVDAIVQEQTEKLNQQVTACQERLEELQKQAATSERVDELELQLNRKGLAGDGDDKRDLRAEAEEFFAGKDNVPSRKVTDEDVEHYAQYDGRFGAYLRRGADPHMGADILNTLSVGSDPDGGYWVPTQESNDIKRRIFETSPVRQVAQQITITTDSIQFPTDTNEASSGGWVGETASRPATGTPQVGQQTIYVREQYAMPEVTQKLLDMASINVESWLGEKIANKLARDENTAFVSGSGVDRPRGFLDYKGDAVTTDDDSRSWGVLQQVVSGAAGGFPDASGIAGAKDPDALITIVSKLKPAYRQGAVWAMNRATEAAIRKLKDGDGRYFVGMNGSFEGGFTGFQIGGFPIVTMEDMPDIASNSYSVAFGNFNTGYLIVDGRGLRVLRDPFTNKPFVRFYTTKWTGGDVVNFDAIKLLKFSA